MPFATIVIPTFNQANFLGQALESIISQTDKDWEAIIVNDGSTDNTQQVAEEYAQRDKRIRFIHQQNGGVAAALNTGLKHARGEWIHWLSSDDLFERDKLAINRRWISSHPGSSFFFSYFTLLRESTGERERRDLWGPRPDDNHQLLTLFYRNYVSGISICVRRSAWEEVGTFDETLRYAQDYDQWLRLLQKNRGVFIPEWTVVSRNHAEQGSETFPAACYFDTAKAAIRFINKHPFPELVPWADLSSEVVAKQAVSYALDVACDKTAFLYCLGPHPALVLRTLEWVFSSACSWNAIRDLVRTRVSEMAFGEGDDDWTWLWRQLALSIQSTNPRFDFQEIVPAQRALQEWRSRATCKEQDEFSLAQYLQRFEQIDVCRITPSSPRRSRVVLLTDQPLCASTPVVEAANQLVQRGYRPIILATDPAEFEPHWSLVGQTPVLRLRAFDRNTLPWLGEVELGVTFGSVSPNPWLGSREAIHLDHDLPASALESCIRDTIESLVSGHQRTVIFLERVLWGGGAERVVFDLARQLDRKRFKSEIWTMFEEHNPGAPRGDIPHRRILPLSHHRQTTHAPNLKRRSLAILRVAYQFATPRTVRQRLGVGRRLTTLLGKAKKRRSRMAPAETIGASAPIVSQPPDLSPARFDFVGAVSHHQPQAIALAQAVRDMPSDAVVVAVMEEATVAAWMAQAQAPFPYIASLHTVESECLSDIYPDPSRLKAERWLFGAACEQAETITLPVDGCRDDLIRHFSVTNVKARVLANPVDCPRVRRQSFQTSKAVDNWKRGSSGFRMVHVGRLDPQKNHDLLLQACAELKRRNREFSLAIVGDGWFRAPVEKMIAELGLQNHVFLVGEQANPFPWIAASNALMLTSRFEAFGLVLVESMICGTPVVSVDCPVGPRAVLDGGDFGMLVAEGDAGAIASAVEQLIENPALCQQLTERGYQRALEFDVKTVVGLWEELLTTTTATKVG